MDDARRIALRYYELINERRTDELEALVSPSYVGHGLGSAGGATAVRHDTEAYLRAFSDLEFTIEDTIAEGDKVVVKSTLRGTHTGRFAGAPASGNTVEVGSCDVFRVEEGKIAEAWTLCDSGTLLMQIAAVRPVEPAAS